MAESKEDKRANSITKSKNTWDTTVTSATGATNYPFDGETYVEFPALVHGKIIITDDAAQTSDLITKEINNLKKT